MSDLPGHLAALGAEAIYEGVAEARSQTLDCRPVTASIDSDAQDLAAVVRQVRGATSPERQGRLADQDSGGSLERRKRGGYL